MSKKIKSLCTEEIPNCEQASKIIRQLVKHPEFCETCKLKKCTLALSYTGGTYE